MNSTRLTLGLLSGLLLAACDSGSGDDSRVRSLVTEATDKENGTYDVVCDCYAQRGFATRAECLDRQLLPAQRRCVEEAHLSAPGESITFLECRIPLLDELDACLNDKLSCDNAASTNPCSDDYDLGLQRCAALPNAVTRDLEGCYPSGGFVPDGPSDSDGPPETTSGGDDTGSDDTGSDDTGEPDPEPDSDTSDDPDDEQCQDDDFICGDGTCIPVQWVCDFEPDCISGEDEFDC